MLDPKDLTRRSAVSTLAGLGLTGATLAAPATPRALVKRSSLVVYFSRSGNTRVIAGLLQRRLNTDLFEILPAKPYPEDYLETVAQAKQERDQNIEPRLASRVQDLDGYESVYLGFPIWGETTPPVIRSFLATHRLQGKRLIPFITHGGYGVGSSVAVLERMATGASIQPGFVLQADQERQTMEKVDAWLGRRG